VASRQGDASESFVHADGVLKRSALSIALKNAFFRTLYFLGLFQMHIVRVLSLALALGCIPARQALAQSPSVTFTDQGADWTPELRAEYYGRDQGSKMIPLGWLRALKQADGRPFLSDNLTRYGYLQNPANANGLPIGFTASGPAGTAVVGMTCSACHTRQIVAEGKAFRIDGGPAFADFQSLLSDLDVAVGNVVASDAAFASFASAVLASPSPDAEDVAALKQEVDAWYVRYHTLISTALPRHAWGPARLDAISMIFDRLTGLDLGPPPSLIIKDNIASADAPVRYPFLWNAPVQNLTQWSGFAANGNDLLALSRNLGEVFGVFGIFQPRKEGLVVNFLNNNSANFDGLDRNEQLVRQIGPPKWPWLIDANLAAQGKAIYQRPSDQGGCQECHGIKIVRSLTGTTWATPVQNVGTDTRQFGVLTRSAKTGALQGAFVPLLTQPLAETDLAINVLATSVVGSIAEHVLNFGVGRPEVMADAAAASPLAFPPSKLNGRLPPELRGLQGAFRIPGQALENNAAAAIVPGLGVGAVAKPSKGAYEARVLQGIWAAAPYLHNGSVPTLAELLKPSAERVQRFKVGQAYDTTNIGLSVDQAQFDYELETTDCSDLNSGNSRCGHEFGTNLSAAEKRALLEYLKTL
jgi:mono/diheme cytochrome c family protein